MQRSAPRLVGDLLRLRAELAGAASSNSGCLSENTNDAVSVGENPWIAREREISRNSSRASVHASDDGSSYAAGLEGRLDAGKKALRLVVELAVADEIESRRGRRALVRKPGSQQRLRVAGYKLRKTRRGRGCHVVLLRVFVRSAPREAHCGHAPIRENTDSNGKAGAARRSRHVAPLDRLASAQQHEHGAAAAGVRAALRSRRARRPSARASGAPCPSAPAPGSATSVPCRGSRARSA